MKILLTSGGTKVPTDEVRHIANMSSGTFGTKIGVECLNRGHDLYFMASKDSKTPTKFTYDFNKNSREFITTEVIKNSIWHESISSRYAEITYTSFDDYLETLKDSIEIASLDAVILAAAVSDYGCVPHKGKIKSKENMTIDLYPLPKIINKVKNEWGYKGILVGFKLLVGATEDELIQAAGRSVVENNCDFVVANDLHDLKKNNHKIMIVTKHNVSHVPKEKAAGAILDKIKELKG